MNARTLIASLALAAVLPVAVATVAFIKPPEPPVKPPTPGELANKVTSFAYDHPEWAVLRPEGGKPRTDTTPYAFGHQKHLSPDAYAKMPDLLAKIKAKGGLHVETLSGGKLGMACTFCHQPDEAGRYMKTPTFEAHCIDCHASAMGSLDIGSDVIPAQDIPHPAHLQDTFALVDARLSQYLAMDPARFAKPATPAPEAGDKPAEGDKPKEAEEGSGRRRRGGDDAEEKKPEEAQPEADGGGRRGGRRGGDDEGGDDSKAGGGGGDPGEKTPGTLANPDEAKAWFAAKREEIIKSVRNNCEKCHTNTSDAAGGAFSLSPQKLPARWLGKSVFEHNAHTMMSCNSCHAAAASSKDTADILLPGIASCRECHSPAAGAPDRCVTCHTFHQRLPSSAQGAMTIPDLTNRGPAKPGPAPAPSAPTTPVEIKK